MDPLTAFGLASNILQFLDFSAKLIRGAQEIYVSPSGDTKANKSLESIVSEMKTFSSHLLPPDSSHLSGDDGKALRRLVAECNILSDQILELLEKVRPNDPNSRVQSVWAALKSKLRERDRQELERRLDSCRNQLELQLSFFKSSEIKANLDTLVGSTDEFAARLNQLQTQVEQLRRGVSVDSISPTAQDQLRMILGISEDAYEAVWRQCILKNLAFPDMYGRFEAVETAHYKTFKWIFEDTPPSDKYHDHSKRQSFLDWLSTGNGIFHVSGKLGSGKSTLMKFLCEHDYTKAELQKWAGDRKLVFANFFFWNPGNQLQKSLDGLFRSLLHDILVSCPELISEALPNHWNEAKLMPRQAQSEINFRNDEIRAAFSRIIEQQKLYEKRCFCFFIDGLDEYKETRQEDYKVMVKLLHNWTTVAPDNVKICVSSREYNVFMSGLSDEKRLCLQDLTREDMKKYTRDKLEDIEESKEKDDLVNAITTKADGIFLWVSLVVKSLRRRLEDGCVLAELEQELDSFPDELDNLFRHLLKLIHTSDRRKAFQTFKMVEILQPTRLQMSLFSWSFIDEYNRNQEFAMQTSFSISSMDSPARSHRIERARKRLAGICQGLVELRDGDGAQGPVVAFTHRSVPEFLQKLEAKGEMEPYVKEENPVDIVSQLFLAELRTTNLKDFSDRRLSFIVHSVVHLRISNKADNAPYAFLESLHSVVLAREQCYPNKSISCSLVLWCGGSYWFGLGNSVLSPSPEYAIWSPVLISAFLKSYEYVAWKIEQDPTIIGTEFRLVLLFYVIKAGLMNGEPGALMTLKTLLRAGLSFQTPTWIRADGIWGVDKAEMSVWHRFILYTILHKNSWRKPESHVFCQVLETFLEYGADPHLWISASRNGESEGRSSDLRITVALGRERRKVTGIKRQGTDLPSTLQFIVDKHEEVSIRDLIEYWQFENSETLLKLLESNVQPNEPGTEVEGGGRQDHRQSYEETGIATQAAEAGTPEPAMQTAGERLSEEPKVKQHTQDWGRDEPWFEAMGRSHAIMFLLGVVSVLIALKIQALSNNKN